MVDPSTPLTTANDVQRAASDLAVAGDVRGVRRLIQHLELSGREDLADIAGLYIETALSYKTNP